MHIPGISPVTGEEMAGAFKRLRAKEKAPGPDGIPGRVWVLTTSVLRDRLGRLFSVETGWFPRSWKESRLVLLKKVGRPVESPSAYRPICLLDEVGKLCERIIAARLVEHLRSVGPDLADCQFGFREGSSTVDAILRVRALLGEAVARGEVAIAVSLDVSNAFNTLPWARIREALVYYRVPPYLRRVIGTYLQDRQIAYPGRYADEQREILCGVPQGSVLGPPVDRRVRRDVAGRPSSGTGCRLLCGRHPRDGPRGRVSHSAGYGGDGIARPPYRGAGTAGSNRKDRGPVLPWASVQATRKYVSAPDKRGPYRGGVYDEVDWASS